SRGLLRGGRHLARRARPPAGGCPGAVARRGARRGRPARHRVPVGHTGRVPAGAIGLPRRRPTSWRELMTDTPRARMAPLMAVALVGVWVVAALGRTASAAVPSEIAKRVNTYKAIPKFVPPGPPIDA